MANRFVRVLSFGKAFDTQCTISPCSQAHCALFSLYSRQSKYIKPALGRAKRLSDMDTDQHVVARSVIDGTPSIIVVVKASIIRTYDLAEMEAGHSSTGHGPQHQERRQNDRFSRRFLAGSDLDLFQDDKCHTALPPVTAEQIKARSLRMAGIMGLLFVLLVVFTTTVLAIVSSKRNQGDGDDDDGYR